MTITPPPPVPTRAHRHRAPASSGLAELGLRLSGRVVTVDDPGWDIDRQAWNLAVDQHPAAVIVPANTEDVVHTVRFAAEQGLRVSCQSTGHGAATLEPLTDVLLLRMGGLRHLDVDPDRRVARVGAGVLVRDLVAAAAPHGLTFVAGSSPDVGVVGYTLGGGVGWLGRRHGLACNAVVGAEVVTAEGEVRRIDGDNDPDLFWALRGGGGAFAVVLSLELQLVPLQELYAGSLLWPIERASEVLHAWRVWTQDVPDTVTSIARLLRFPPVPDVPEPHRGRRFIGVEAAFLGEPEPDIWLRPLRALRPEMDSFSVADGPALGRLHGDPEHPVPAISDHLLLGELPPSAVEALLASVGPDADAPLVAVDVRHLGGAMGTSAAQHGVLDRIDAAYAVFAVGIPATPALGAAIPVAVDGLRDAMSPWSADTSYLNFADRPVDPSRLFGAERFARLQAVKASYDPGQRLVSNHPIPLPG